MLLVPSPGLFCNSLRGPDILLIVFHSFAREDGNEKIREILLEIEKVVSDFAVKENYDIILNDRVLIYGNPVQDLTEDILTILNK